MEHLHPTQAYEIIKGSPNTLLIDCRTEVEFYYVGHPTDAINIEWNTAPDFELNPHFADQVLRMAGRKDRQVILICRSGKRSVDAINIEWNTAPDFDVNPHFADQVLRMAGRKDRQIILICRSGKRSVDAGQELEKHGFTNVANVLEGFEGELDAEHHRGQLGGWRKHGLPWRQV